MGQFPKVLAIGFLLGLLAPAFALSPAAAQDRPKIGVILPLSGNAAYEGELMRRGLELAVGELQASVPVELIFEDSQGDTKMAVTAFRALRAQHRVSKIISWGSGIGLALLPLANQEQVLQLGVATSSPKFTVVGDLGFRIHPTAASEAAFTVDRIKNFFKASRVALVTVNNDYGNGLAENFKAAAVSAGIATVFHETFEPAETDFRTLMAKLKSAAPDLVYLVSYAGPTTQILRRARELGIKTPFLTSIAAVGSANFVKDIGSAGEGLNVIVPGPAYAATSQPEELHFRDIYEAIYHETVGPAQSLVCRSFDALMLFARAAKDCGWTDQKCFSQALLQTQNYRGASGKLSFDQAGDSILDFSLQSLRNGSFVAVG